MNDFVARMLGAARTAPGRRSLIAALVLGAGGLAIFTDKHAGAAGGDNPAAVMLQRDIQTFSVPLPQPPAPFARSSVRELREPRPERRRERVERPRAVAASSAAGSPVCVRLCDGSFFPSSTASGGDAACQAQCPDAPVALYVQRAGSDRIEDAVSTRGTLYSALPVAGRYRTVTDETCVCHRDRANYLEMVLKDPTLRRGDAVMTPAGVVVYQGSGAGDARLSDFVALAKAPQLSGDMRRQLSVLRSAPSPASARSSSLEAHASPRAKRGSVWVESP